jgi:hypothetical protein
MATLDQAGIDALKAKHGTVYEIPVGDDSIIVRGPTTDEWASYKAALADRDGDSPIVREQRLDVAARQLVIDVTLWPETKDLAAILARRPAIQQTFAVSIGRIAGVSAMVLARKL